LFETQNLVCRYLDVSAGSVGQVQPCNLANNLAVLMPDGIPVAKHGKVGSLSADWSQDHEKRERALEYWIHS
jgi:hypothetical protein